MSVFSGFNKLKDALDDAIHDDQKTSKGEGEATSEIHGEVRKEHEIKKKSGWSDKVSEINVRSIVVRRVISHGC